MTGIHIRRSILCLLVIITFLLFFPHKSRSLLMHHIQLLKFDPLLSTNNLLIYLCQLKIFTHFKYCMTLNTINK